MGWQSVDVLFEEEPTHGVWTRADIDSELWGPRSQRSAQIRDLVLAGYPLQRVAERFGLSVRRVRYIARQV